MRSYIRLEELRGINHLCIFSPHYGINKGKTILGPGIHSCPLQWRIWSGKFHNSESNCNSSQECNNKPHQRLLVLVRLSARSHREGSERCSRPRGDGRSCVQASSPDTGAHDRAGTGFPRGESEGTSIPWHFDLLDKQNCAHPNASAPHPYQATGRSLEDLTTAFSKKWKGLCAATSALVFRM